MKLLAHLICVCTLTSTLNAVLTITTHQVGSDFVFRGVGTIDTSTSIISGTDIIINTTKVAGKTGLFQIGSATEFTSYDFSPNGPKFGPGGNVNATSFTGDPVSFRFGDLYLLETYVSGAPINFEVVYANADNLSLGLSPGLYSWTLAGSGDTVTMEIIPEPSTYIALAGFVALGLFIWQRRVKNSQPPAEKSSDS